MPRFLPSTLALALGLTLPVAAQTSTHTAGCAPHAGDQLRCAVQIPNPILSNALPTLDIAGNGLVTGDVQRWTSLCGSPGETSGVRRVSNKTASLGFSRAIFAPLSTSCVEMFIFNCRDQAGQGVPCQRSFGASQLRLSVAQRG